MSGIIAINLVSDHLAGEHNHVKLLCQVGILTVLHNYHIFNSYNGDGGFEPCLLESPRSFKALSTPQILYS